MRWFGLLTIGACAIAAASAAADIVERKDGSLVVGQVLESDDETVRIRVGPEDSEPTQFSREDVKKIWTPAAELSANLRESSADTLEQRAAAYHRAGLEFDALICLERLFQTNPKRAAGRVSAGQAEWQTFKSRSVISMEARRVTDAAKLIALARRAAEVGDRVMCGDLIHRAQRAGDGAGARAAGLELGVPVRAIRALDLTPCLFAAAEVRSIQDENADVYPQPDRVFVHVPVRVDVRAEWSIAKGTLRGRDARSLYGLRPMRMSEGRLTFEPRKGEPVYERLEVAPATGEMVFRNLTPPRRTESDTSPRDRVGPRERRMKATEWVALIFELRPGAVSAGIQLPGEIAEELDLSLIRHGRVAIPTWTDAASPIPEKLTDLLERLERAAPAPAAKRDSLRASTLLALAKLDEARKAMQDRITPQWRALTDQAVVYAIAGGDPTVGAAAWKYLEETPAAEMSQLSKIVNPSTASHYHLARAIESAVLGDRNPPSYDAAVSALAAVLAGGDAVAADRTLDALERIGERKLWFALAAGSPGAKKLALARLHGAQGEGGAARMIVSALVAGMDAAISAPILAAARKFGLEIAHADDPVIQGWLSLQDRTAQAAYLQALALAGGDLAGVWHSGAISTIARDVYASRNTRILAAWSRMVAAHRGEAAVASDGMFPLLVARESADPDLLGLNAIAAHGAPADRRAAIGALLSMGFAEEVQRARGADVDADWPVVLSTSVKKEDQLAVLGLVARWSESGPPEVTAPAMSQLSRLLAEVASDRAWQAAAAIKSGLSLETLNELSWDVDPASSGAALRVAYATGHMTQQERERVAGAADQAGRLSELIAVDLRRGQLVDGAYGVLAIVETTTRVQNARGGAYWGEPVRTLMVLPSIRLEVDLTDDKITALLAGKPIGTGRAIASDRVVKPLPYYYGVLEALDGDEFVIQNEPPTSQPAAASRPTASRPTASRPAAIRAGPLVLPDTRARTEGPGLLTIDLCAYADELNARVDNDKLSFSWPKELRVSLRYHLWGTWVGCGRRAELPAAAKPGEIYLLNIMLIVERMN